MSLYAFQLRLSEIALDVELEGYTYVQCKWSLLLTYLLATVRGAQLTLTRCARKRANTESVTENATTRTTGHTSDSAGFGLYQCMVAVARVAAKRVLSFLGWITQQGVEHKTEKFEVLVPWKAGCCERSARGFVFCAITATAR